MGTAMRPHRTKYAFALAVTAAAIVLRVIVDPFVGDMGPLIISSAAILVAALFGGFGPGLVAMVLGAVAAGFLFMEPRHSFVIADPQRQAYLVLYAAVGLLFCVYGELYRRREVRLRQGESRYRTLFDTIQDGFCIVRMIYDDAGKPIDYLIHQGNPAFAEHTGLKDAVGKTMREVQPNIEPYWIETYGRIAKTGVPERFENYVQAWDRWFDVYAYRFDDPANHEVAIFFRDISARRRMEQELAESEENFRRLAENLPQLAWMTDASGGIFWYNRRWFEYTGTTLEEMQGWGWQKVHHPDHVQRAVEKFKTHIEAGEAWEDTFPLRGKDGEYRWFLSRAFPIRNEQNEIARWFGTNTDITEIRELDQRKDQFLAVLSHELRNPLAAIHMAVQLLKSTSDLPVSVGNTIGIVDRQTTQLWRLVDDLLDMSRITRGTFELDKQIIDLDSVLQRAIEAADPSTGGHAVQLKSGKPDEPLLVDADPLRLSQVISNLIGNACKYSKPGSTVDIVIERNVSAAVIRVRDTGVGIPPDRIERIFEMFAQVDPERDRRTGGLGIGLALAQRIVHMHGGTIEARSEGEGKGSEFVVTIPLARSREQRADSAPDEGGGDRILETKQPRRILAVDDNVDALTGLAGVLRSAGHDVLTAEDGLTALSLAAAHQPEAALVDIGMPGMDGYELAQRIRSTSWGRDMTLIALTGWGQDKDKDRAARAGFNTHLTKPADMEAIERALVDLSASR
jgi:PAS domain S-box-containing protein